MKKIFTFPLALLILGGGYALLSLVFNSVTTTGLFVDLSSTASYVGFNTSVKDWVELDELNYILPLTLVNDNGNEHSVNVSYLVNVENIVPECDLVEGLDYEFIWRNDNDQVITGEDISIYPNNRTDILLTMVLNENHCALSFNNASISLAQNW